MYYLSSFFIWWCWGRVLVSGAAVLGSIPRIENNMFCASAHIRLNTLLGFLSVSLIFLLVKVLSQRVTFHDINVSKSLHFGDVIVENEMESR